ERQWRSPKHCPMWRRRLTLSAGSSRSRRRILAMGGAAGLETTMLWMDVRQIEMLIREAQELSVLISESRDACLRDARAIGMEFEVIAHLERAGCQIEVMT